MTIHQLSIFMPNEHGRLSAVLNVLREADIQLIATTIADTSDFGIYRIICNEPVRAYEELKGKGVNVSLTDVFAIELDDKPGSAAAAVERLSNDGVDIAYMYSFLLGGKGIMVFRANNSDKAQESVMLNGLKFIAEKDLSKLG
ncbi:MAG: amino acid-binding protein [Paludibacteraceae bacterium]|jgi:hypothetical protein|nr:amino acid-binding protein [Paludibacteraceae bacterium]